jgi:hypothetical protein
MIHATAIGIVDEAFPRTRQPSGGRACGEVNFGGGMTQGGSRCAPWPWAGIRLPLWGAPERANCRS